MSPSRSLTLFSLFGSLAACASGVRPDEDVIVPTPPSETARPKTEVPVASVSALVNDKPSFLLPRPTSPSLGSSCVSGPEGKVRGGFGVDAFDTCGARARVSIETANPSALRELQHTDAGALPCNPEPVGQPAMFDVRACVAGDELVAASICTACRALDSGTVVHARLGELTKDQAAALFRSFGLKGEVATTPASWARAIADAKRAK